MFPNSVGAGSRRRVAGEHRLAGAVEGVPERELDARGVDAAGVRPRISGLDRVGVDVRVAVPRELVEQRRRAPAHPVRLAERRDPADGRDGRVARRVRQVVAARREADADHVEGAVVALQLVVAVGEHGLHRGRRRGRPVAVPDRRPEARLVRLIADDDLAHVRVALHHDHRVVAEGLHRTRRRRRHRRQLRVDREDDLDVVLLRNRDHPVEERLVLDRRRRAGIPEHRDAVRGRPELVHLGEEPVAAVVRVLRRVVGEADVRTGDRRAREPERQHADERRKNDPHRKPLFSTGREVPDGSKQAMLQRRNPPEDLSAA